MIIPEIFLQLREKAIEKLGENTKYDSFGYHIDVVDAWESIYNSTELLSYLSIHSTHSAKYSELCFHMKDHLKQISNQINAHIKILNAASNMINTSKKNEHVNKTRAEPNFKYDLLEMGVDWLFLKKYMQNINTVLDFGAGCGRQIIGCHENIKNLKSYIGIDASLNGYTIQNILYGTFALLNNYNFFDLIDYESSSINIKEAKIFDNDKSIIHFPAWQDYSLINDKSIDLILACHVHNELSKSDFLRLMKLVETKLSDNGIFYIRSELGIWSDNNYEDKVKYHSIDPVEYLKNKGIYIVETEYFGGFMTTIFSRSSAIFYKNIKHSKIDNFFKNVTRKINKNFRGSDHSVSFNQLLTKVGIQRNKGFDKNNFPILNTFKEATFFCATKYLYDEIERILDYYGSLQYVNETFQVGNEVIDYFKTNNSLVKIDNFENLNLDKPLLISSIEFWKYEDHPKTKSYKTRLQYTYPVVMLLPDDFSLETPAILERL